MLDGRIDQKTRIYYNPLQNFVLYSKSFRHQMSGPRRCRNSEQILSSANRNTENLRARASIQRHINPASKQMLLCNKLLNADRLQFQQDSNSGFSNQSLIYLYQLPQHWESFSKLTDYYWQSVHALQQTTGLERTCTFTSLRKPMCDETEALLPLNASLQKLVLWDRVEALFLDKLLWMSQVQQHQQD